MTAREIRQAVSCPACGARAGSPCRRVGGVHAKRKGLAELRASWTDTGPTERERARRHRRRWA